MKLRADLKKKQGAAFPSRSFTTTFSARDSRPIKIVREALLGDDSPAL